jgi:hypothetical protein
MRHITAAEVRQFLVERYAPALSSAEGHSIHFRTITTFSSEV